MVPSSVERLRLERERLGVSGLIDAATPTLDSALDSALRTLHSAALGRTDRPPSAVYLISRTSRDAGPYLARMVFACG